METEVYPGIAALRRMRERTRILETCAIHMRRAGLGDLGHLWSSRDFAEEITVTMVFPAPGTHWEDAQVRISIDFTGAKGDEPQLHLEFRDPHGLVEHRHFNDPLSYENVAKAVAVWRDKHTPGIQSEWDPC